MDFFPDPCVPEAVGSVVCASPVVAPAAAFAAGSVFGWEVLFCAAWPFAGAFGSVPFGPLVLGAELFVPGFVFGFCGLEAESLPLLADELVLLLADVVPDC